jgi:hydroxymethylpyrimidine pyrophosphatase-like HAD family hydrolase
VKVSAIAVDYDDTIAQDGVLSAAARQAILEVRARGIVVLLVTGRILGDLRRVAGDLQFVDAIVAENGAVLSFPGSGRSAVLGHPPPAAFVAELKRRGLSIEAGESVVEAHADDAHTILSVIREMQLPLTLLFNRARLMVLPQSISKATGLHDALATLRLSPHNTLAIGDAENDHALLDACEVGVAVEWGSPALKAVADEIATGSPKTAVADYLRRIAEQGRFLPEQMGRRRLLLGHTAEGDPVKLVIRGRNMLIAGEPGTGKSWVAGLVCEQLILQGYSVCIIDPEGDYRPLESLPGVVLMGGEGPPPQAYELVRALRHPDVSVVLDLSKLLQPEKTEYLQALLPTLADLRRRTGLPHRIVLDEAHYFLEGRPVDELLDLETGGYTLVTYRLSNINPAVTRRGDTIIVATRESEPREIAALAALCGAGGDEACAAMLNRLAQGEAVVLPGIQESNADFHRFRLAPRLTAHVRHRTKYLDMPVGEGRAFYFEPQAGAPGRRVRTLKAFMSHVAAAPTADIDGYLRRSNFSQWIREVFRDFPLASDIERIEEAYQLGQAPGANEAIVQAIRDRYEFDETPHGGIPLATEDVGDVGASRPTTRDAGSKGEVHGERS